MDFSRILMVWYLTQARALPWRSNTLPYNIWLSEVILQQTRIDQGLQYYLRFLENYPDIFAFASAPEDDILKLWQGLGYYSRARNMLYTAREIVEKYNGSFPNTARELQKLKGIGPYTAAAIASICFHEAVPVLDGNAIRVYARCYGITEPVDSPLITKQLFTIAAGLIDQEHPGTFNQAVMEFGALLCRPANPDCNSCPLAKMCLALQNGTVDRIPVKLAKKSIRDRYLLYFVMSQKINDQRFFVFNRRTGKDIWKNLFDFPSIESSKPFINDEIHTAAAAIGILNGTEYSILKVSEPYKHQLTHQTIQAVFVQIEVTSAALLQVQPFILTERNEIGQLAIPRLIDRYLEDEKIL
jgi:A/G-specific adenine glycosylase